MENKVYSGIDISDSVSIERDKETKTATFKIGLTQPWRLYVGKSIDSIDESQPFLEGNTSGSYTLNVSNAVRSYFKLMTPNSTIIFSDKHLPMSGGYNFRDLGGTKTKDGRFVKWGKLFRADDLHNLTDADLNYISSIPLTSIVDFRSTDEIKMASDKHPQSVEHYFQLPITPGNLIDATKIKNLSANEADTLMMKLNVLLVSDTAAINQYKKFFALLQNENDSSFLYHCSAGKDRTGMATALILVALGVDKQSIIDDYLASNYYLSDKYSKYIKSNANLKSLFEVKQEFIQAGFDYIDKEYGSIETYLTQILDVDLAKMKQLYLY